MKYRVNAFMNSREYQAIINHLQVGDEIIILDETSSKVGELNVIHRDPILCRSIMTNLLPKYLIFSTTEGFTHISEADVESICFTDPVELLMHKIGYL